MSRDVVLFLLLLVIGGLLAVIVYQRAAFRTGMRRALAEVTEKLRGIVDGDTDESVLVFTESRELSELTGQINRLLEANRRRKAEFARVELASRKMLSNISHDIKTPMTVVLGYLEMMRLSGSTALEVTESAEMSKSAEMPKKTEEAETTKTAEMPKKTEEAETTKTAEMPKKTEEAETAKTAGMPKKTEEAETAKTAGMPKKTEEEETTEMAGIQKTAGVKTTAQMTEMAKMAEKAERKARDVMQLVDEFFTLAKLEAGDMELALSVLELNEICRESVLDFYEILSRDGFSVEVEIPETPLYGWGNRDGLRRILSNLISNAVRYGAEGKFLGIRLRGEGSSVRIDVIDRGPGIERAYAGHVFDRLFTMEDSRSRQLQGNGLGLTIAKNLALQMGGDVTLESIPHRQTVFTVRLKKAGGSRERNL